MIELQLQQGLRVGNYVLQSKIGDGAFSVVWKATHYERPDRVVAIKIATDPAFRRQLGREARLPEINHPNVVPILDSDTRFGDVPYVVMPFCDGGNLSDLIAQHPTGLPLPRVNSLILDILEGLGAAHDTGLVHRDLKPSNILLNGSKAIIGDFGLSIAPEADVLRSMVQSLSIQRESAVGIAGTLAYMAPEILGGGMATPAADVFSVGVLLFEVLTGRRPCGPELPSQLRSELASHPWNDIYSQACCSLSNRFLDAKQMLSRYLELFPKARRQSADSPAKELRVDHAEEDSDLLEGPEGMLEAALLSAEVAASVAALILGVPLIVIFLIWLFG